MSLTPLTQKRGRTIVSHSMSIGNLPSYWENGHRREPAEPFWGYSRVLAVQQERGPTPVESLAPNFLASSLSKNATNMSLQRSHPTGSAEWDGNRTNVVEPYMSQDPTARSGSQRGGALGDDEHFIWKSEEELKKEPDTRMIFIWNVIADLTYGVGCWNCPERRELWLRIIEGDDDDDDLWLWVDGDEERLTKRNRIPRLRWPDPIDWPSAQSALRQRVTQRRYPPACAIAWLIVSSKAVAELFASHGYPPPTFRTHRIASTLSNIVCKNWDAFPSRTDDWTSALTRSRDDGCICSLEDCHGLREWFDMTVWLEDIPPTLVVGNKPCVRCRSLLRSRYDDIAANCAATSHVSLLDAIEDNCKGL
ncbi:hypothetical protein EDD15DRAFT_1305392 [Pisolithus albus]|nr:hypothetical protein EDD15DRAFT_1305392 [Pisolithus albus]